MSSWFRKPTSRVLWGLWWVDRVPAWLPEYQVGWGTWLVMGCWNENRQCHRGLFSSFSPAKSFSSLSSPLTSMPASTRCFFSFCRADNKTSHRSGLNAGWKAPTWSCQRLSRGFCVFINDGKAWGFNTSSWHCLLTYWCTDIVDLVDIVDFLWIDIFCTTWADLPQCGTRVQGCDKTEKAQNCY